MQAASYGRNMILLGAGFSHNFGGFLAYEMTNIVFGNLRNRRIKSMFFDDTSNKVDFEILLSKVIGTDDFDEDEKRELQSAIERAFHYQEDALSNWEQNDSDPLAINLYNNCGLNKLLSHFFEVNGRNVYTFIFALNQDLFLERRYHYVYPGLPPVQDYLKPGAIKLPQTNSVKFSIDNTNTWWYLKLHGSYNWLASDSGSSAMVLGIAKRELINKEPLLKWYWELFSKSIKQNDTKLLIIGYSFRDEYVNEIILDGVLNYGLKLFIIDPAFSKLSDYHAYMRQNFLLNRETAKYNYKQKPWNLATDMLKKGLCGYYPYNLQQIFPPSQRESQYLRAILKQLIA